ncbi:MAG: serine/threonine-protein kinase, partial [Chloroflexota bacterium]
MVDRLIGRKLGQYEVVDRIGAGGMATVYKGYRPDIDRTVAIKILKINAAMVDEGLIQRFELEAKTIARLQHPHILSLFDYGVEDDLLYLVMAYIDGGSLGDWQRDDRVPPVDDMVRVLKEVAGALDYAHRQGIVHRDIKPDNILIDSEGHAMLADFGIVKITGGDENLTATGGIVGTPAYLAPEQGAGEEVSESSDIYALGVVMYELLTGKQPYRADTAIQVIIKHMNDPVPDILSESPSLPPAVGEVMKKALAKTPQERYVTATAFSNDFAEAIKGGDVVVMPTIQANRSNLETVQLEQTRSGSPAPTGNDDHHTTMMDRTVSGRGGNRTPLYAGIGVVGLLILGVIGFFALSAINGANDAAPTAVVEAVPEVPTFGRLTFSTTEVIGDTVTLRVDDLPPPGDGEQYVVWLRNTETEEVLSLGAIQLDAFGSGDIPRYVDEEGRVLPAFYNAVWVTTEEAIGDNPEGEQIYADRLPAISTEIFTELFITSELGVRDNESLFDSVNAEAVNARSHAGLAQAATSVGGMTSHAEHTINILNGTQEDFNNNGRPENPGFGVGVVPLLDEIEASFDDLAAAEGASTTLQSDIEFVRVCLVNSRERSSTIESLSRELLATESIDAVQEQLAAATTAARQLVVGNDANDNGQVDPFENECGIQQIGEFALL